MTGNRQELLQTLAEKMFSVMRRVHMEQGFRFNQFKLSRPHVRILFFVARQRQDVALKDLAEMLEVTPGAVTQFVDTLVQMNLVERQEDVKDRRVIRIKLTALARSKLRSLRKGYLTAASRVFDVLSDAEIRKFVTLLDKLDTNQLQRENKSGTG